MQTFVLAIVSLWLTSFSSTHDFHVSRLTINQVSSEPMLQLTLHSFIDDVEAALADEAGIAAEDFNFLSEQQHPDMDSLLVQYLRETLSLEPTSTELEFLGYESADDPYAVYLYLRAPAVDSSALRLSSSYLLNVHDDQQNIVVWQRNGKAVDFDLLTTATRTAARDE